MRLNGLQQRAELHLSQLAQEEIDSLNSYSAGVAEAVRQMTYLPSEF